MLDREGNVDSRRRGRSHIVVAERLVLRVDDETGFVIASIRQPAEHVIEKRTTRKRNHAFEPKVRHLRLLGFQCYVTAFLLHPRTTSGGEDYRLPERSRVRRSRHANLVRSSHVN